MASPARRAQFQQSVSGVRPTAALAAFLVLALMLPGAGPALAEGALLKPDTPKMDTGGDSQAAQAKPGKAPLQGSVQHQRKITPPALRGGASSGRLQGNLRGRTDSSRLKARTSQDALSAEAQSGIGIIGVKFVMLANRPPVINRVFPQTPAYEKGLQTDDIIIAVDGIPTSGLTKEEVYDLIVGTPGTPVTLSVNRAGAYLAVTLTRMDLNDITDPWIRRDYMMSM